MQPSHVHTDNEHGRLGGRRTQRRAGVPWQACPVTVGPADDDEMKMAKVGVSCVACAVCGESVQESSGMD
jgi:hypothetical protein